MADAVIFAFQKAKGVCSAFDNASEAAKPHSFLGVVYPNRYLNLPAAIIIVRSAR